uniref:Uncharacterized protein n=1 Tax=Physcomitrium patens TaxID=3218 RepID=A0A2K1IBG4_PHYPA|nr:hypothetical protein PHYPA_030085 [Physcomitrium patens]
MVCGRRSSSSSSSSCDQHGAQRFSDVSRLYFLGRSWTAAVVRWRID